ncbi:MAG: TolC family protein [Lishizhenia sp.]
MYRLIFLLCFISSNTWSQEKLTAADAVAIALENNYGIQIGQKQVAIAEKNNTWSEAGLFPTVTLNATLGNAIQDNSNNPVSFIQTRLLSQNLNPQLNANWNIFSGMGIKISKDRLALLEEQSNGNLMLEIENTTVDVLKNYYSVLLQQQKLELINEVLTNTSDRLSYIKLKEQYGQTNSLEVIQFNNQFLNDSINYIQQEVNLKNAKQNLLLLLNSKNDNNALPTLTDSLTISLNTIKRDAVLNGLKNNNQNLKNQYINLRLQEKNTDLARSFLYPVVSISAGLSPSWGRVEDINNPAFQSNTEQVNYFANIAVRYNLFNNWKTKRSIEVAKIQTEIAQLNLEMIEDQLVVNTNNLIDLYNVRLRLLNLSSQNIIYAKKAYQLAIDKFENGTISSLDLINLKNNYITAGLNHLDNLYGKLELYLELLKSSGNMQLEYN